MQNKILISKLRDNAELAQAAYGYFHLIGKRFESEKIRNTKRESTPIITQTDILDMTYNKHIAVESNPHKPDDEIKIGKLDGDMTPTQAQRFFSRYDLLIHQPNTESGFSATLFGEKRKQKNTESKAIQYTSEYGYTNYILAIRGTEPNNKGDIGADTKLALGNLPKKQHLDMLLFYNQCIGNIPFYVERDSMPNNKNSIEYKLWKKLYQRSTTSKHKAYITKSLFKDTTKEATLENFIPPIDSNTKLTITGHSLGGCLTQLFALSFANYAKRDYGIIQEIYTYNAPGARDLSIDAFGVIDIDLANLSSDNKEIREKKIEQYIHSLDLQTITQRFIKKLQRFGIKASYSDGLLVITEQLKRFLGFKYNQEYRVGLKVELRTIQENGSLLKTYKPYFIEIDSLYVNAYNNLIDNYHFHREKRQGVDIGLPTHHIETDSDNNPNNKEKSPVQNLGEDIEGKHYYLNIGIDIDDMDSHSIKNSVVILYFYDYLLDLEANRKKLSNHIKDLESKPQDPATLNYIGYKAAKNKGKYQFITALLNDFMQWNDNSLREVNEVVLSEVKNKYKEQKKNDKNTSNPPEKIFPLVYLLNEVSYIARFKDSKDIEEFNIYRMIDLITQLQEAKIYIKILDKKFFDELENKQCSVAELRSVLKCQPFMVVDENNKEVLNESNRAEIFYYKTFNNLVSQILQSYKTA
ncbi:hypothetical protein [uncultured Helicobacter sp.]|uniref:lipase family protein n=1 Tax=uncultured Helicobacter sp. TaxID=175537 RepID=UPI0026102BAD|nr:hypothetical protein [uncultured Helicobacter sp.]